MKRVAVTQLHIFNQKRAEYRDELDSGWAPLLEQFGLLAIQVPNLLGDTTRFLKGIQPDAIVLTGGGKPGSPESRSRVEADAIKYAFVRRLPLLGVCRGMQVINLHFGGTLSRIQGHVGLQHEVFPSSGQRLGHSVNSYHEFAVDSAGMGTGLLPLFHAADGTVEAFRHLDLPWSGIMWHPEREETISAISRTFVEKLAVGGEFEQTL